MANIDNVQLPDGSSYNIVDNTSGFATQNYVDSAVSSVTKTTIGLGNVDNTSDLNKPISTATQAALDTLDEDKADKTDIATVESGTTASASHATGSQFYFNGQLVTATANISIGGTIVLNGNCVPSSNLTDQIDSMTAQYFDASAYKTSYISSMSGCILKIGRAVSIQVYWSGNITGNEAIMVIPQALRPGSNRSGGGTARMASGVESAEYYVTATDGHIVQNLTSTSVTNGSFTIAYTI